MPIVIAAVALVGILCLLDLLLTFGVIRRLREHTALLSAGVGRPVPVIGLSDGEHPGAFSTLTTGGEPVRGTTGLRVVAFFSSQCSVCPVRAPTFANYLSAHRVSRESVLAISVGPGSTPPSYLSEMAQAAQICVEKPGSEIAQAFKVNAYPSFILLDADGAVAMSGPDPAALPQPATV
jgi:thiol-disulfide isomerase/thioredoxin